MTDDSPYPGRRVSCTNCGATLRQSEAVAHVADCGPSDSPAWIASRYRPDRYTDGTPTTLEDFTDA